MDGHMILATWHTWLPHVVFLYSTWVLLNWFIVRPPFTARGIVHHLLAVTLPLLFIPSVAALLWLFVDLDGQVAIWTALAMLLVINGVGHFIAWRWPRRARAVSIWRTFGVSAIAVSIIAAFLLPGQRELQLMLMAIHGMYMLALLVWLYPKTPVQPPHDPQNMLGQSHLEHVQ